MTHLRLTASLLGLALAWPGRALAQDPASTTPTATPAPARKSLGGGPTRELKKEPEAPARSLADAVKKTQVEHPVEVKKRSLGVITNESVKNPVAPGKGRGGSVILAPPAASKGSPEGPAAGTMPEARDNKGRSEADWKRLATVSRERISGAEAEVKRLELEVKRLENDFYAWSDGNYRDRVIRPSWDQAKEDLKKARLEIDQSRAAAADLEDEARKSGAPPGWLR